MLVGIERSAMAATQSGRVAGSIWKRLRRIVLELRSTIRLDASARRDAQILLAMDDRELDDVGLTRAYVIDWASRNNLP